MKENIDITIYTFKGLNVFFMALLYASDLISYIFNFIQVPKHCINVPYLALLLRFYSMFRFDCCHHNLG